MDKRKRMEELIKEIEIHNRNYYELDNPTISDIEYDKLYYELVDLEKELNLVLPNSPTQRVGGDVLSGFKKKVHEVRLYSLNKVRSTEELDKWIHDMKEYAPDTIFTLEYKFDGLQLVIEYEDGKYKSATTRGNGMIGEDVTAQVKTIRSLPLEIPFKGKLIVQGEGMGSIDRFYPQGGTIDERDHEPFRDLAGEGLSDWIVIAEMDIKRTNVIGKIDECIEHRVLVENHLIAFDPKYFGSTCKGIFDMNGELVSATDKVFVILPQSVFGQQGITDRRTRIGAMASFVDEITRRKTNEEMAIIVGVFPVSPKEFADGHRQFGFKERKTVIEILFYPDSGHIEITEDASSQKIA